MLVLFSGLVTFIAAQHYIRIFYSCVDDTYSHRWPRDVHRSLPLHQDLQLLRDDAGYHLWPRDVHRAYHYIRIFNSSVNDACSHLCPRDVHRSSTLHQDLQFSNR